MQTRRLRELLAIGLICICVLEISLQVIQEQSAAAPSVQSAPKLQNKHEKKVFGVIARLAYFSNKTVEKQQGAKEAEKIAENFQSLLLPGTPSASTLTERIVLAKGLEQEAIAEKLCMQFFEQAGEAPAERSRDCLAQLEQSGALSEISDSWLQSLATQVLNPTQERADELYNTALSQSMKLVFYCIIALMLIALSSFLLFSTYAKFRKGVFRFRYQPASGISVELVEAFALYLALMLALPTLVKDYLQLSSIDAVLLFNICGICALSVLYFWPRLQNAEATQESFGLAPISLKEFLADAVAGPRSYIAFISLLFCVIILYSLILQLSGIDPSSGAHPIVPLLQNSNSSSVWILVALLAVVVAPLVEEIFFRGALYGWLRCRLSAWPAIFISAMIFAAIHPQGALGLVPLSCIGIMLAFLREWRKSLVSPILAHACVNGVTLLLASTISA